MNYVRKANKDDISRICEFLVFVKRVNYLPIFKDYEYSFKETKVLLLAEKYFSN